MAPADDVVTLGRDVLRQYVSFTRFNSPYPAHDAGDAIDLYPGGDGRSDGRAERAPSPVAGEVVRTLATRAPKRPYAAEHDHLIVVDTGEYLARILHVEPAVDPGDVVAVGDSLGSLVRSGYFAPWVDNHVHLGFRPSEANPIRAGGSLPLRADVPVEPVAWDGTGIVVERGETYVVLDAPGHPDPGAGFAGIAADAGGVVDGGLPHYEGGGLLGGCDGSVSVVGQNVGRAAGECVTWDDVAVLANGHPVTGLSFGCHRERLGAKLVSWDGIPVAVGDRVEVEVRPA